MRLDIGDDDLRYVRRERVPDLRPEEPVSKHQEPLITPGSLDRRVSELRELAGENRFPEIPRRQYERRQAADPSPTSDERHVRSRHHLQPGPNGIRLRSEEKALLGEAGRFRVLSLKDAAGSLYGGDERALRSDLRFLKEKGLASVDIINARRDGRSRPVERIEVLSLTREGEKLARQSNSVSPDQKLYHGLVKPREAEHDTQIYRAYRKEWERIEKEGGANPRVLLDFELKSQVQRAIHAARKEEPDRDIQEIKREVAAEQELPFIDGQIQIPDARIAYDLDQGSRSGFSDIEVVTAAYRPGHLRAKAQAGFHTYISGRDAASISHQIEGEHHLLDHVFDL
ncbi:hypothetical protein [Granulicella sp. dw_53]|uniref:hypothetical protein n=1 Tax=Granulicella sp. dw_53 TaxID=2719792 RepID=UPI001BD32644|nr:hypothetical protein [Granulicella sp. dw_53]